MTREDVRKSYNLEAETYYQRRFTSKVGRYMDLVVKKKLLKHLRAHETSKSVPSTFSLTLPTNSSTSISTIEADLVQKAVKSAFLKV